MMKCENVREILPAYQDGMASAEQVSAIEAHLNTCSACQREGQLLSATWNLLEALPSVEPSPDFRARFWERVRREEVDERSWFPLPRLIPAFAGLLGVWVAGVGLGLYLFTQTPHVFSRRQGPLQQWAQGFNASSLGTAYVKRLAEDRS